MMSTAAEAPSTVPSHGSSSRCEGPSSTDAADPAHADPAGSAEAASQLGAKIEALGDEIRRLKAAANGASQQVGAPPSAWSSSSASSASSAAAEAAAKAAEAEAVRVKELAALKAAYLRRTGTAYRDQRATGREAEKAAGAPKAKGPRKMPKAVRPPGLATKKQRKAAKEAARAAATAAERPRRQAAGQGRSTRRRL